MADDVLRLVFSESLFSLEVLKGQRFVTEGIELEPYDGRCGVFFLLPRYRSS